MAPEREARKLAAILAAILAADVDVIREPVDRWLLVVDRPRVRPSRRGP